MQMEKLLKFFISIFVMAIVLASCSSRPSLELTNAAVELNNDEERLGSVGITSGDKKGETMVPIALSYDIALKNIGEKKLGGTEKFNKTEFKYEDGIGLHIEPNEKLKDVLNEVMGFNIYDEDEMLGLGETGYPVLEPNQVGKYTLDFNLGALEENPDVKLAPPLEQLEKLEEHAMNASLIVSVEGEIIAHFDLSNLRNSD